MTADAAAQPLVPRKRPAQERSRRKFEDILTAAREACALWHCRFGVRPQTYKAVRRRFFAPKPLRLL